MTDSVTVEIPVVISQPAGNGYVHLQIGTTHRDFVFVIQAIHPIIQLCLQTVGGTCNSDAGFGVESGKLMGVDVSADGTTETIPLEGTSSDLLHTGDPFLVKVSLPVGMGPSVVGATWRGTVKAVGAIALVSDGGTVASSDVTYTKETNEITLPAVVTGVGVGTISAAVGSGTPTVANRVAVSASQAVYTVKLLRYAGLGAVNQFTVCSTRRSGSLHLQMADAEGSVVPSDVVLTSAIGDCPAGYASHADLVWTGFSANAQLAISDTQGVVLDVVPTIGTTSQVSVRQSAPSVWTCAAESSEINDGGTTSAPTDSGADTKKCPGSASVLVELEFRRSAALPSPNTSDVASAGSTIQVQTPPGISAASSRLVTDLNGKAFLQLSVPKNTVEIPLVITVDSRVTQAVPVE